VIIKQLDDLLVAVWREASRHMDIAETTVAIAGMLASRMPIDALLVRELDVERSRLESPATGATRPGVTFNVDSVGCAPAEVMRFLAWCQRREVARHDGRVSPERDWALCLPRGTTSDALVGPLTSGPLRQGVLVVLARAGERFDAGHAAVVRALLDPFSSALENHHRLRELTTLREAAEAEKQSLLARLGRTQVGEAIVGTEAGLRPVMARVALVARSDVPVLILGETGAGKEVIARAIHTRSSRADGPFIRVNCGAIPPDLIDSHLFGHERGSFTGAVDTRKGWFERADGGTLFLDEIGDLPLAAQVRLLRVLQDGHLDRIGGQESLRVDTRIVTATHRDLTAMVREGRFREDLWYRIAVFPVLLPPLRERREDIPELARHFAQRAALRFGLRLHMPSADDLAMLVAYAWPGNIRELAAVIDRAAILGNGEGLEIAKALGTPGTPIHPPSPPDAQVLSRGGAPDRVAPLDAAMRQHIESALAATRGRIEGPYGAAHLLKVNPHTLRARMRRLGIEWGRFRSHL
jgi:transcriptional regulator with GAF, ATPase, and Fis domain